MFKLQSKYSPTGDQPKAIESIIKYLEKGYKHQTLWGVTGSGKTFVMANIIQKINKPTLIIAHNKTLAAQLALEFKDFFPDNAVHYFVSYYDYYQPEAYVGKTDTYIEKEATINAEIDRLRHAATQDLIKRKDVIIVASVSCIYGVGDISAYEGSIFEIKVGEIYKIDELLKKLVLLQYKRAGADFKPGTFQVMGDLLEIFPSSLETVYSIEFWGDEVSRITRRNYLTGEIFEVLNIVEIFPAKHTVTTKDTINKIVPLIQEELKERLDFFQKTGEVVKHERLKTKVEYDIEMMQEVGYVNGIENYSRYLDGRKPGAPPATLIDYFGDDFLCLVDESHMTFSQIGGMYAGDRARKENLVGAGFRLPSAMDNRPLRFEEFENKMKMIVSVSATPGEYDIKKSCDTSPLIHQIQPSPLAPLDSQPSPLAPLPMVEGNNNSKPYIPLRHSGEVRGGQNLGEVKLGQGPEKFFNFNPIADGAWYDDDEHRIVPLVIRPTGLLDPIIELRSMNYMVDDIMKNIKEVVDLGEKMLITTLTKRSSEELTDYLLENGVKVKYLHSEIETLERIETLKELRTGKIDVIVGVNLLREGLDLPEVTKIAILDADKQGFLRSTSALIQIIGRAARNSKGRVYMYSEERKIPHPSPLDSQPSPLATFEPSPLTPLPGGRGGQEEIDFILDENGNQIPLYRFDKGKFLTKEGLFVSNAMKQAINLTNYRRKLQREYNEKNGITPTTVFSEIKDIGIKTKNKDYALTSEKDLEKELKKLEFEMGVASANMEYERAAELRDEIIELRRALKK